MKLNRPQRVCAGLPRVDLCGALPTPLEEMPRLSGRLDVKILIKREDQTGPISGQVLGLSLLIQRSIQFAAQKKKERDEIGRQE